MVEPKTPTSGTRYLAAAVLLSLLLLTYSNHFNNAFHFDDSHAVLENPWIRDLRNIPRFFTDGSTFSALPANRSYRPIVTTTLAVDYWLAHGLNPFWFHLTTFIWFAVLCGSVFVLYRGIANRTRPAQSGWWAALVAAALYALHPVEAETVNYVVQRGDLFATLGVVAGLVIYAQFPRLRRWGVYLLPVILGVLSKPSAAVFPALLLLWIWLFEPVRFRTVLLRSLPAFLVTGAAALFTIRMDPPSFVAGAVSTAAYRFSQPAVLMHYFRRFFLPTDLTADTDHFPFTSPWQLEPLAGFLFLATLLALILWTAKTPARRPIAFGLAWFLVASTPTSLVALAELENDHRMFLPFVGLALSVIWTGLLIVDRWRVPQSVVAGVCATAIAMAAFGAHERNRVWHTEESLWLDVTRKSPANGRGLMNYGITQMAKGEYKTALDYLNRSEVLNPDYYVLEINLGVANGAVGNTEKAEEHFARALELADNDVSPRYYYARWLSEQGRYTEALAHLAAAEYQNPDYLFAPQLEMEIHGTRGDATGLRAVAQRTLARFPSDPVAKSWLSKAVTLRPQPSSPEQPSPEHLVDASLALYHAHRFEDCIAVANQALKLRPGYAEAWNNIAAAQLSMKHWDEGIAAAKKALELKPDLKLARDNLAWAEQHRNKP